MIPIVYRQAAKILQSVKTNKKLSVKSLALEKQIDKKRQTYALVMETLKYSAILERIIARVGILVDHPEWWNDMVKVLVYDLVMGKGLPRHGLCGEVHKYKSKLQAALKRIKRKSKAQSNADLLPAVQRIKVLPRYVRVNTLKVTVEQVVETFKQSGWEFRSHGRVEMFEKWKWQQEEKKRREEQRIRREKRMAKYAKGKWKKKKGKAPKHEDQDEEEEEVNEGSDEEKQEKTKVKKPESKGIFFIDPHVRHLLVFPPNTPMHNHPMVKRGELVLMDKASCLPAYVLLHHLSLDSKLDGRDLQPEALVMRSVMDVGAAPGNKTSCLAAIGGNTVNIVSVEKDKKRMELLRKRLDFFGCEKVTTVDKDFLALDPSEYKKIKAILLDPSCTGSGIVNRPEVAAKKKKYKQNKPMDKASRYKKVEKKGKRAKKPEGEEDEETEEKEEDGVEGKVKDEMEDKTENEEEEDEEEGDEEEEGEEEEGEDEEDEEEEEGATDEDDTHASDQEGSDESSDEEEESTDDDSEDDSEAEGSAKKGSKPQEKDGPEAARIRKLAAFQKRMLLHALKFPNVDRVVYSTCSIHAEENEQVVGAVLADPAVADVFKLVNIMPGLWPTRADPLFQNAQYCIRCDPAKDYTNGFFVACIERIRAKERRWEQWKVEKESRKRKSEELRGEVSEPIPMPEQEINVEDVLDPETRKLARMLGKADRKRFKADADDPANYPVVDYKTRQKCSICQIRGHFSRDCLFRMCTICRVRGHNPEDCPQKPADFGASYNKSGSTLSDMANLVKETYGLDYKSLSKKKKEKDNKTTKSRKEQKKDLRERRRENMKEVRKLQKRKGTKPKQQRKYISKLKKAGKMKKH